MRVLSDCNGDPMADKHHLQIKTALLWRIMLLGKTYRENVNWGKIRLALTAEAYALLKDVTPHSNPKMIAARRVSNGE